MLSPKTAPFPGAKSDGPSFAASRPLVPKAPGPRQMAVQHHCGLGGHHVKTHVGSQITWSADLSGSVR